MRLLVTLIVVSTMSRPPGNGPSSYQQVGVPVVTSHPPLPFSIQQSLLYQSTTTACPSERFHFRIRSRRCNKNYVITCEACELEGYLTIINSEWLSLDSLNGGSLSLY